MKKFILFFFALVASVCAFAQGTADFNTLKVSTSYAEEITTADGWVINYSAVQGGVADPSTEANPQFALLGSSTDAVAVCLNGHTAKVGRITSPKLEGGIGNLSFNYGRFFNDDIDFSLKVEVLQNEEVVFAENVTIPKHTKCTYKEGGKGGEITLPIKVAGDFVLVITNNCPSQKASNGDRISLWNLSWTGYVQPAASQITSLDQLSNDKAYAIHALTNEGYLCYNPEVSETSVSLCGVTDHSYQGSVGQEAWELPFNASNPNHAWQIASANEKYYIYNIGAKKFLGFVGNTYKFVDEPVEIDIRTNGDDETVSGHSDITLGGTFSIRIATGNDTQYVCVCTKNTEDPVKWWTYNDHGGPMLIDEIEVPTDDIMNIINGEAKQKELNETLANTIAEVTAAYAENSVYEVGENLITANNQFSSPHSSTVEGSLNNLLDGETTTYWHSDWTASVASHLHYLQVDLPEAVSGELKVTLARRNNNGGFCDNDNVVLLGVEASADGNTYTSVGQIEMPLVSGEWYESGVVTVADAKSFRFFNDKSNGNNQRGYWHASEFQLNLVTLIADCYNAQNPNSASALVEALAAAKAIENATEADIKALQKAYEAYLAGDNAPVGPVYCTAAQLRENAEKGRFALLGVTATGDHYLNGEAGVDHVSADGTLAGVRDPEANEIVYLVKSGDQYLIQREDTKQFFQIAAGQNIVLVDDATAATPFEIYGKDDAGYATGGFDDLFSDLEKAYDDYMIRFKANGQWLNTQGANAIGGLRGGTGAWSFQYVRYMGEHEVVTPVEPEPTAVTFEFTDNEDGTITITPSDLKALYFFNIYSDRLNTEYQQGTDAEAIAGDVAQNLTAPESEVHTGVSVVDPAEWLEYWFGGYVQYTAGDYRLGVVELAYDGTYSMAGEPVFHAFTKATEVEPVDPDAFPAEGVAYKFKNVDSQLYVKVIDDAEQCVTLGQTPDEMFFTAVEGGWTISTSKGYQLGSTAKGWNIGNTATPIVWTIEEVEGGYAFKNEKGYLGYDTAAAGQKAFRDKNYTTHHGVFNIWKYDEEEIIVVPDKTLEETWENIHTLLAEAEAIKELNEVTVTYDSDGYFEDFTSPIVGKVGYKKHDDVWAVCDGADYVNSFVNYFETAAEADAYLADFGGLAALEEIITNVIDDYNAAEVVLPTPGKTYIIRNYPYTYTDEYSYAYYYNGEKLALSEAANATTAEYMWTMSEPVKYSYFDADLNVIEETRYQFVNAADNTKFMSWRGNGTDNYAGVTTNAADANSKWYLTGKKVDGSATPAYGTLALRTNADGNQYRTAVVDMRKNTDHLAKSNGDHFDATYSSWFIFEEVEIPVTEWDGSEPVVEVQDATTVKVTFTDAHSVEASNFGVLGAIFDEQGDVTAIVFNDLFGDTVEFGKDCATLHFKKISKINAELAEAAKGMASKVTAAANGDVKGKVIICSKSFKIDGTSLYNELIVKDFDSNNGTLTGIDAIANDSNTKIFDLQGRRVVLPAKGIFVKDGRKVVK